MAPQLKESLCLEFFLMTDFRSYDKLAKFGFIQISSHKGSKPQKRHANFSRSATQPRHSLVGRGGSSVGSGEQSVTTISSVWQHHPCRLLLVTHDFISAFHLHPSFSLFQRSATRPPSVQAVIRSLISVHQPLTFALQSYKEQSYAPAPPAHHSTSSCRSSSKGRGQKLPHWKLETSLIPLSQQPASKTP